MTLELNAPGAYRRARDHWGSFEQHVRALEPGALVVMDQRVARLFPRAQQALAARKPRALVLLKAGEGVKTLHTLGKLVPHGATLSTSGTLVCVGGGTLGDLATVAAHVLRRGVNLVHVPTTLLAAVDSSLGGKGALHARGDGVTLKNALGVFHYAQACWLDAAFFQTLQNKQVKEGQVEAFKMAACLDAKAAQRWVDQVPDVVPMVRAARGLKEGVCAQDPYDRVGVRKVLNFGHTFGHVLESVTGFRVSHGLAVGMGMLCALDVGRALGVTHTADAALVEDVLRRQIGAPGRSALARALDGVDEAHVAALLAGDKKGADAKGVTMVLLQRLGKWQAQRVGRDVWRRLLRNWKAAQQP